MEQSKIYPLNGKASAKPMKFPDASGVPANMLPISDGSAFDQLKRLVDSEGANLAESDSLGMLAAIGIVKGQPFNPDAHTRDDPRSGREDRLQDEPCHRLSRSCRRPRLSRLSGPPLGQSHRRRHACESGRADGLDLEEEG